MQFDAFFPRLSKNDWDCRPYSHGDSERQQYHDPVQGQPSLSQSQSPSQPSLHQDEATGMTYKFIDYTRIPEGPELNPEEMQYLDLCRDILQNGVSKKKFNTRFTPSK